MKLIHNDLTSFDQLRSCQEMLMGVKDLVIDDNPICKGTILRPFIAFAFPNITTFNGGTITEQDRHMGSELFGLFVDKTKELGGLYTQKW